MAALRLSYLPTITKRAKEKRKEEKEEDYGARFSLSAGLSQ